MPNAWQDRVGTLFSEPNFVYKYKPVDSPLHGGAVRIDWFAIDYFGLFWMTEVKRVAGSAKTINLKDKSTGVSPLQWEALSAAAEAQNSVVLLAVGQEKYNLLYLWGWRHVEWLLSRNHENALSKRAILPLETARVVLHWTGRLHWPPRNRNFRELFVTGDHTPYDNIHYQQYTIRPRPTVLSPSYNEPDLSLLTLKQRLSTHMQKKEQRLASL